MRVDRETRQLWEDRAAAAVGLALGVLPRRPALALGRGLGRLLGDLDRRHVAIAVDNLRRAFPEWDQARLLATARSVYAHFGQVLFDILWLDRRSRERILALADVADEEHVRAAYAMQRGVLFVTAHIGNWELHGLAHGWLERPMAVVARALDNPRLDRRLSAFRSRSGNPVIYKQKALSSVLRSLRAGGGVAFLIDQNVQAKDGIFVDFFGRPAATTTAVAALALKVGCPILAGHSVLQPNGRYLLRHEPPILWTPGPDRERDIIALTQHLTTIVEGWVREHPEQWLWIHRRWKTQPETALSTQPSAISSREVGRNGDGGSSGE